MPSQKGSKERLCQRRISVFSEAIVTIVGDFVLISGDKIEIGPSKIAFIFVSRLADDA